ncbi:MAG: phosphoribosylamine--glycine ligase [Phycisphaerae bacterium]
MNIIVVGGGGREHALVWAIAQSKLEPTIFALPGNAGTHGLATNISIAADDIDAIVEFAQQKKAELVVVGPEAPLCAGLVDRLEAVGIKAFGPSRAAAKLEGDKAFAKTVMKTANVPTADAKIFHDYELAKGYVASRENGLVVKAAGLAAGKGVAVCEDPAEALLVLEKIMLDRQFGEAGSTVLVEEKLTGEELSVLALVDGQTIHVLETAQDHKPVGEGDTGPNTGGMGAYSPAPRATEDIMREVEKRVLVPIVDAMRNESRPYQGVLYAGLMLTPAGPKVLEFNCRFGDPEAQAILMRLDGDLLEVLLACVDGRLADIPFGWKDMASICVVMCAEGYPGSYKKGVPVTGLGNVASEFGNDVVVFHAGTKRDGPTVLTSGGRVLGVTALGNTLAEAAERAYAASDMINFDGAFVRRDIGHRAL